MANMLCKTKGNADPKRKSRVYFTCHPADLVPHLENLCAALWSARDCAVYYTEDMTASIQEQDKSTDLESHNLFVVPVTRSLLTQPNRAMDQDIPYAVKKHIPVLPIMVEPNLDALYSRPDKFGTLQYLNAASTDKTEISFEEKLKTYLSAVLLGDSEIEEIRTIFRARIFLSYRKKDRYYANALMQLIHSYPEFQDIAIWYDEFLTPGESFQTNIDKALANCPLFALLVTPSILEEQFGKPNFVMGEEYPAAKKAGIPILPFEMLPADKAALREKFPDIPPCIDPHNEALFRQHLLDAVKQVAPQIRIQTPLRKFYLGVAYWAGIDVETNRERGLAFITKAAEAGTPEAMGMLYHIYEKGMGRQINYREAAKWAQRMADYCSRKLGESHHHTLTWTGNLAALLLKQGDKKNTLDLMVKIYNLRKQTLGEEHPDTLAALNNLGMTCSKLKYFSKAQVLLERTYQLSCTILGKEHPETVATMNNLATVYNGLGDHKKALNLITKVYLLQSKLLGSEHPSTLTALSNSASIFVEMKEYQKALDLNSKVYRLRQKVLGEEHPDTIATLNHIAVIYHEIGEREKALSLKERVYSLQRKVLGPEHPDTLRSMNNIAVFYALQGNYKKAASQLERLYTLRCRVLGAEHPDTKTTLKNLLDVRKKLETQ